MAAIVTVNRWIHPEASELMHGCSQLGEGRVKNRISEEQVLARWGCPYPRKLR
jgi:hypothetical protein